MKEIFEFMEISGKKYMKYFLLAYLVLFGLNIAGYYYYLSDSTNSLLNIRTMFMDWYVFIVVYNIHGKRFRTLQGNGTMHRIMLLPGKKMSFVYSELLYVGATITMIYVTYFLAWYLALMMTQNTSMWQSLLYSIAHLDQIFFQSLMSGISTELPIYWLNALQTISVIVVLTYGCVRLLIPSSQKQYRIYLFYIIMALLALFIHYQDNITYTLKSMLIIAICLLSAILTHYNLYKRFGRKVKIK